MLIEKRIKSFFESSGLKVKSEASNKIIKHCELHRYNEDDIEKFLTNFLDSVLSDETHQISIIDLESVDKALKVVEMKSNEPLFTVYDVFTDIPSLIYDSQSNKLRKIVKKDKIESPMANPEAKSQMFTMRYKIMYYRLSNSKLFSFKGTTLVYKNSDQTQYKFQIMPIMYLTGQLNPQEHIICLGMLTFSSKNELCLEDDSGIIKLDVSETFWQDGIFTEGCFVLAEGSIQNNVFHALAIGFPPIESHEESMTHLGDANFFAAIPLQNPRMTLGTQGMSRLDIEARVSRTNDFYVILSDLHFDVAIVQEKFDILLQGYENNPPVCFIICGCFVAPMPFTPGPGRPNPKQTFLTHLMNLALAIKKYPNLVKKSKFVFVPHIQDDIGLQDILPRPPLPPCLVKEFFKDDTTPNPFLPKANQINTLAETFYFGTNPSRIQEKDHQIVVYRQDIAPKMFRNNIYAPSCQPGTDQKDLSYHLCHTLLSQCHLSPLPLLVCPRYWEYDNALLLYPLPDLVICADKYVPYHHTIKGCTILNPGSFSRGNYTFKIYYPSTRSVEDSAIP